MHKIIKPEWVIFIGFAVWIITALIVPENLDGLSWTGVIILVVGCIYLAMDLVKSKK